MKTQFLSPNSPLLPARQSNLTASSLLILMLSLFWPGLTKAQLRYTNDNGAITITGYLGQVGDLTIPSAINGLPVKRIGEWAFIYSTLKSVFIPDSVTSIDDYAFLYCAKLTHLSIPASVTNIGFGAFAYADSLLSVTIGDSNTNNPVTSVGDAFNYCRSLTNVIIGNGVARIAGGFLYCDNLVNVTIGKGVKIINRTAFSYCPKLTSIYFQGNLPGTVEAFGFDPHAIAYYRPGTFGWGASLNDVPVRPFGPPTIVRQPLTQTAEVGSVAKFWVQVTNLQPALTYQWFFDRAVALSGATNASLELRNVEKSQAGNYTLVVRNPFAFVAVTSSPAALSVIAPVQRSIVPAVVVSGSPGSLAHLEYSDALERTAPHWLSLSDVILTNGAQISVDPSGQFAAQRFYRAWQNSVVMQPSLDLIAATEIPLTGAIGSSIRIDYINQFGATNDWVTLNMVTLTNTTQSYFDVSMFGQPHRLYRLVTSP